MRVRLRAGLLALSSLVAGLLVGYWLQHPLLPRPDPQSLRFLMPLLRSIDEFANRHEAWYLTAATVVFVANLPNTLLMSCLAVLLVRRLNSPRLFFYAALTPPLVANLLIWLEVSLLQAGARRLGQPSEVARLPIDPFAVPMGLLTMLNFALFGCILAMAAAYFRRRRGRSLLHKQGPT